MNNAEKFKNEILIMADKYEMFAIKKDNPIEIRKCTDLECDECLFNDDICFLERTRWLLSEYKEPPVKLTRLEQGILEYLFKNKQYKFIVRERNGFIYIYKSNPKKEADSWRSLSLNHELGLFNNLFQFVKFEDKDPTSIKDVLANCEVIEDA